MEIPEIFLIVYFAKSRGWAQDGAKYSSEVGEAM